MATVRCESAVAVGRAPAAVFDWLIEPELAPRWMSGLRAYEALQPGPLAVGSRIRQELEVSGQLLRFELEVARLERPDAAELRFEGSGFRAANEYRLAPAGDRTRVTWTIAGETTSFSARMLAPMVQGRLQEKLDGDLERLRSVLDA